MIKTIIEGVVLLIISSISVFAFMLIHMENGEKMWDSLEEYGYRKIIHAHGWRRCFLDSMIKDAEPSWFFVDFVKVFMWPIALIICFLSWIAYATVMSIIAYREIDKDGYEREDYNRVKWKKESK